jgi:CheY-like chemotaxis protein
MLTARDIIDDKLAGLDAGADDYLVKLFEIRERPLRSFRDDLWPNYRNSPRAYSNDTAYTGRMTSLTRM